jgi:hypothetical protein
VFGVLAKRAEQYCCCVLQTIESCSGPEVGFEDIYQVRCNGAPRSDLLEARLWTLTTGQRDGGQLLPVGLTPKDAKQWVAPPGPLERAASSNLEASSAHNCFNVGL